MRAISAGGTAPAALGNSWASLARISAAAASASADRRQRKLREVRQRLDPRRLQAQQLGRAVGQHDQDRQIDDRARHLLEQIVRGGVDPVQIFQHQQQPRAILPRLARGGCQAIQQQRVQRALARTAAPACA